MSSVSIATCHRSVGALFVILMAILSSPGDAFKIYDLLSGEDVQQRSAPENYESLEECTSQRCHGATLSRVTRAMCVLQCVVKTSPDPDSATNPTRKLSTNKVALGDRQVDPMQACIEAKCLDSGEDYYNCAYRECIGRRAVRSGDDMWGRLHRQRNIGKILQTRSKRPVEVCEECYPGSPMWDTCQLPCSSGK